MAKKLLLISFLILVATVRTKSQELNCNIQIRPPQIAGFSTILYQNMQRSFHEFMNNTNWTKHEFMNNERIECSILINISSVSGTRYTSTIQIISNRPVFNTNLQSPMLNYKEQDNQFEFEYFENQNLEFNESRYTSNLTSVLAFYAYLIIGLDYDSYSLEGGTEYFQKAQRILNNAQGSNEKGWRAFETSKYDNRYYLVENLLNSKYSAIRRASYRYHRLGLDIMSDRLENGRREISESLRFFQNVYRQNPNLFIIKLFFDAKYTEIINIFAMALPTERQRVYDILKEVDPGRINQYEKLIKAN